MTLSPEKEQVAKEIGEAFGELIGGLIGNAIVAGIFYAILHFLIGLSVTYLQVFGALLLINFLKNFLKK